ncbi:MAG: hypothetical protein IJJ15_06325 [Ruminococcus sp.]|nr:hypothetical protein [Ruminococcus sp.]
MKSQDLFSAIENIDSELLYDARASHIPKIYILKRAAIAAAVVLILLTSILIYANFVMPVSTIDLESGSSVMLTVNARGNILSVVSDHKEFSQTQGKPATQAVEMIIRRMIETGNLSEDENTILISTDKELRQDVEDTVRHTFDEEHFSGCEISVEMKKEDLSSDVPSPAKSALIDILTQNSDCFTFDSLTDLSVNELCLLLKEADINDDSLHTLAEPSQSKYIGRESAGLNALKSSSLSPVDSVEVRLSVYHRKLVYLVTLRSGDSAEVYFINATDGKNEHIIKTTANQAEKQTQDEVRSSNTPSPESSTTPQPYANAQEPAPTAEETASTEQPITSLLPTEAVQNPAISSEYTVIPITMRELSFNTMTPPSSAKAVNFNTLFEGQYIQDRSGDKKNEGSLCVITDLSQWDKFLSENNKAYADQDGYSCPNSFTESYFDSHSLLICVCMFSDASYYTTVSNIDTDMSALYIDDSLSYGDQKSGEYYCFTLSIYELDKNDLSSDMTMNVY